MCEKRIEPKEEPFPNFCPSQVVASLMQTHFYDNKQPPREKSFYLMSFCSSSWMYHGILGVKPQARNTQIPLFVELDWCTGIMIWASGKRFHDVVWVCRYFRNVD